MTNRLAEHENNTEEKEELKLTDEQVTQIKKLLKDKKEELTELRKMHEDTANDMKEHNVFAEFAKKALLGDDEPKVEEKTPSDAAEEVQ